MKSVLLLLMASAMGFSATAADSSLMAYNSAFAKRNATVEAANKECLKTLQALTKTAKGETLTMIWQGIKELDPTNEEALKALAAVPANDLLGVTDPKSTINAAKAQILERLIKTGKYTEADWDAMPGEAITIDAKKWHKLPNREGSILIIVPHPTEIWYQKPDYPKSTWRGVDAWTIMAVRVKEKTDFVKKAVEKQPIWKVPAGGLEVGSIQANDDRVGSIRIKVYEVIP